MDSDFCGELMHVHEVGFCSRKFYFHAWKTFFFVTYWPKHKHNAGNGFSVHALIIFPNRAFIRDPIGQRTP